MGRTHADQQEPSVAPKALGDAGGHRLVAGKGRQCIAVLAGQLALEQLETGR